jgi:hypothetical protein
MKKLLILTFVAALLFPVRAFSLGEAFSTSLSGNEYCGDFNAAGFGQEIFVFIASDTELIVSFVPDFAPESTFSIFGHSYFTGSTSGSFVGGQAFVDSIGNIVAYVTIQGTAKFDKTTGLVKSLSGTFIENGLVQIGCFSSGKFKTGARIF